MWEEYRVKFSQFTDRCHFSYWAYNLANCPYYYKQAIINKVPLKVNKRTSIEGTLVHTVFDEFFKQSRMDWEWIPDNFESIVNQTLLKNGTIKWKDDEDRKKVICGALVGVNNGVSMLREKLKPGDKILHEYKVENCFLGKLSIGGRIDVFVCNGFGGEVIDFKHTSDVDGADKMQLLMYCIAMSLIRNVGINRASFLYTKLNRIMPYEFSNLQFDDLLERLYKTSCKLEVCKQKQDYPAIPGKLCFFCGVKHLCSAKGGSEVVEVEKWQNLGQLV
jgi:CRISPR/Cas system-associated exonuclease Cas4 (RecB family)